GLHKRNQLFERSLVSAAPVAQELGDLLSRGRGRRHTGCSTPQILTRPRDFYSLTASLKNLAQSLWVSGGLSALPHEPAPTTDTPERPKQKAKTRKPMK